MPKRLVVCCDGTWNTPDQKDRGIYRPTNVVKAARAVRPGDDAGIQQIVFYDEGVGTHWGLDRVTGGAFGAGLVKNIVDAYRFLVLNYEDGDEIWGFGFSRGAYTVRSLVGMIRNCGVLRKTEAGRIPEALALYRDREDAARHPDGVLSRRFRAAHARETVAGPGERHGESATRVRFLGVWDTVGALGIPLAPLNWLTRRRHQFHDVRLSRIVDHACQALAIDERRRPFVPALWDRRTTAAGFPLEQVWFAGVHGNVGGGYADEGLADAALAWMLGKARDVGLALDDDYLAAAVHPDPRGELRDSMTPLYRLFGQHVRAIGVTPGAREDVDSSALVRRRDAQLAYAPANLTAFLAHRPKPG